MNDLSRRQLLGSLLTLTAGTLLSPMVTASPGLRQTAADIMGPFYPVLRPLDEDMDLTRVQGKPGRAQGQILHLAGRVTNRRGQPVAGARIELWQANTHGRYSHASDPNTAAPLDENFQGFSRQLADAQGCFRFKTVIPGYYPVLDADPVWTRTRHLHFDVSGQHDRVVTQVYFQGDALNDSDLLYQALSPEDRATVTVNLEAPRPGMEPSARFAWWDVVLASG